MTVCHFLSRDTLTKETEPTRGHLSMEQITGTELRVQLSCIKDPSFSNTW